MGSADIEFLVHLQSDNPFGATGVSGCVRRWCAFCMHGHAATALRLPARPVEGRRGKRVWQGLRELL